MSSRVQHAGHPTGVANGDYIEVTLSGSVVAGNKLVIVGGSYNAETIAAGHFTKASGTATVGSFTVYPVTRSGDGFSAAIAWVTVTGSGTCTIRMNVSGNNYYNLYVAEWSGLGPVIYSETGQNSTGTTANTAAMSSRIHGRAFGVWTNATGTVTITPHAAWTEEYEYEDNSTTLCLSIISRTVAAPAEPTSGSATSVQPSWTLSGDTSWIAAGVIFAELPPEDFTFGERVGNPSGVQTQTLHSPYWIPAGARCYVGFSPWHNSSSGINPTTAMVSDNLGNAASSYYEMVLKGKDDYAGFPGTPDPNVSGSAIYESPAITDNATAPQFTIDIDPGGSAAGYWTGGVSVVLNPHADDATRRADTSQSRLPSNAAPGDLPAVIPYGTLTKTRNKWRAIVFGFNRGHESTSVIPAPTEGGTWLLGVSNRESSAWWSGHMFMLLGTAMDDLSPTQAVTNVGENSVTKTWGVAVLINTADSEPVGSASIANLGIRVTQARHVRRIV